MNQFTAPIETAFEVQRATIQNGQRAVEQGVAFQQTVAETFVDTLDAQATAGRRSVELSQSAIHSYLDAVEANVPGSETTVAELRDAVDEQFEFLLDNHAETVETVESESREALASYDEVSADFLDALDEQVQLLVEVHEDVEDQSVETVEGMQQQVEDVQEQVEEMQEQVEQVQQQAAEAVDIDVEA